VTQCVLQFRLYDYSASYGSARFIDAGHACPMPEDEPAFHADNGPKQKITEQAEIKDKREDPRRLKLRGGDTDQLAKTFAAAKELGRDGAGHDADRADLEPSEYLRQARRHLHAEERLPAACTQRTEEHA